MADSTFLTPVAEDDPCGPDMRWDADFLALGDKFAAAAQGGEAVVDGEVLGGADGAFEEVIELATVLSQKTKDVRVLAIYAEASWHQSGLAAFAAAMAVLAEALEAWPGGEDGIHPRADEFDGDLGERAAALGKLVNQVPTLTAKIGWGGQQVGDPARLAAATALRGVFGSWTARLEPAFGIDLPSASDAWRALQSLVGTVAAPVASEADASVEEVAYAPPPTDAWDLIDQALERMVEHDHHSPALPLLRLLSSWRELGIIEIADGMRGSGVTLEQLLASVKQQTTRS